MPRISTEAKGISPVTVRNTISRVQESWGWTASRSSVIWAVKSGLVPNPNAGHLDQVILTTRPSPVGTISAYRKLGLDSKQELVIWAVKSGLVQEREPGE